MDKDLIELQLGCHHSCVIIKTSDATKLTHALAINAGVSNSFLYLPDVPPFAAKIDEKSKKGEICYLIIADIDKLNVKDQNRYLHMVKDRNFGKYVLPENCIIVFTVKDEKTIKKISPELYHLAVVAI